MRSKGGVGVCARTYDYGQASEYIQCCDSPASAAGGHGCSFLLLTAIATFSGDLQDDFSVPLSCYLDLLLRFHSSSSSRRKSRRLIDNVAVRRKRQLSLAWIHSQVGIGMWRYKMTKAAVGERSRDRRPACFIRRLKAFPDPSGRVSEPGEPDRGLDSGPSRGPRLQDPPPVGPSPVLPR
ncbi:hypothetical protein B296_00026941, partial [Ensete ventricosum]